MPKKTEVTHKTPVIRSWGNSNKHLMADRETTGIVLSKDEADGEYVISTGIIEPGAEIPEHLHLWEDQTFHIIEGELEVRIDGVTQMAGPGATIQSPRNTRHYMRNTGETTARLISYIFPGHWAEEFMAETSRQNRSGQKDLNHIKEKFGVIYT